MNDMEEFPKALQSGSSRPSEGSQPLLLLGLFFCQALAVVLFPIPNMIDYPPKHDRFRYVYHCIALKNRSGEGFDRDDDNGIERCMDGKYTLRSDYERLISGMYSCVYPFEP